MRYPLLALFRRYAPRQKVLIPVDYEKNNFISASELRKNLLKRLNVIIPNWDKHLPFGIYVSALYELIQTCENSILSTACQLVREVEFIQSESMRLMEWCELEIANIYKSKYAADRKAVEMLQGSYKQFRDNYQIGAAVEVLLELKRLAQDADKPITDLTTEQDLTEVVRAIIRATDTRNIA